MTDQAPDGPLQSVRTQPAELETAAARLEKSLAGPSADPSWREGVAQAVREVDEVLSRHVSTDSGVDDLPASVAETTPGLTGPARRLSDEHTELTDRTASLQDLLGDESVGPDAVRDAGADLAGRLLAHVHTADDLLRDAGERPEASGDDEPG